MQSKRSYGSGSLRKRGDTWYGQWYEGGRRIERKLGCMSEKDANKALVEAMVREKRVRPGVKRSVPQTVAEVGALVQAQQRKDERQPTTIEAFESNVRVWMVPRFREEPLSKITSDDVDALMEHIMAKGRSPKTAANVRADLGQIFRYAIAKGWLARNPVEHSTPPRAKATEAPTQLKMLTLEQAMKLVRDGPKDDVVGRELERDLYLVAALTGLRKSELQGLCWADVTFTADGGWLHVWRQWHGIRAKDEAFGRLKSKGLNDDKTVPMIGLVARCLDARAKRMGDPGPEDHVFPHPVFGGPMPRSTISGNERFKNSCIRAEVPIVRFHDLRHTFASEMAARGVPMTTLAAWMGHSNTKMTDVYVRFQPKDDTIADLNGRFADVGGPLDHEPVAD